MVTISFTNTMAKPPTLWIPVVPCSLTIFMASTWTAVHRHWLKWLTVIWLQVHMASVSEVFRFWSGRYTVRTAGEVTRSATGAPLRSGRGGCNHACHNSSQRRDVRSEGLRRFHPVLLFAVAQLAEPSGQLADSSASRTACNHTMHTRCLKSDCSSPFRWHDRLPDGRPRPVGRIERGMSIIDTLPCESAVGTGLTVTIGRCTGRFG